MLGTGSQNTPANFLGDWVEIIERLGAPSAATYGTGEWTDDALSKRWDADPEALKAHERTPYLGIGPTACVLNFKKTGFGLFASIDARFSGSEAEIDRQEQVEASKTAVQRAFRDRAVAFAMENPDVFTAAPPGQHEAMFFVFMPNTMEDERVAEAYEAFDREFFHEVPTLAEALTRAEQKAYEEGLNWPEISAVLNERDEEGRQQDMEEPEQCQN